MHVARSGTTDSGRRLVFGIQGMHCASCVARVETALAEVSGVREVQVDLATGQALVLCDGQSAPVDALLAAVGRLGFQGPRWHRPVRRRITRWIICGRNRASGGGGWW